MKPCRECKQSISEQAYACPHCGAPRPALDKWDGWGFEYKSQLAVGDLPLLHIAFKYRPNFRPVVARGVIAVGQFGCGVVCLAQFGVGVICVSQFALGVFVVGQFALAYSLLAQIGLSLGEGHGQLVWSLRQLFGV